jgi:prepilin-type N-terminal cleavage/methylation domain-containing protein
MCKVVSNGNERGYSLPEVITSMAIFAMVGVTFVSVLATNVKVLSTADQRTTAESLAKTQMEAISNAPYDSTAPYSYNTISNIPSGYGINVYVALVNPETGAVSATDLGVQKVTVTVTCQQRSPQEVITMQAYKR